MKTKKARIRKYACDFETTVYEGQDKTEVWSACIKEIGTDKAPRIFGSIESFFDYVFYILKGKNKRLFFHNLSFDGSFCLNYLLRNGFTQAFDLFDEKNKRPKAKEMPNKSFNYVISNLGSWYCITICVNGNIIEIRDSLKLLPFSLEKIGKDFNTPHQKLTMEYKGERFPNCYISPEEKEYILNDVYVLAEALEIMFGLGYDKITIGACCMAEYKNLTNYTDKTWGLTFPKLYDIMLNSSLFGSDCADEYIRKSYHGGWCYCPFENNHVTTSGYTLDVNSLYPSVMHSVSGSYYPIGKPTFWNGNYIPEKLHPNGKLSRDYYYFVRFKCSFEVRNGYLPFVQIKNNVLYKSTEMLKSSMPQTNKKVIGLSNIVTLTMTMVDFALFQKHYIVKDLEIIDGCYFSAVNGLFDDYIDHFMRMKEKATIEHNNSLRTIAKLFLNNLYGRMASSKNSSFKYATINDNNALEFDTIFDYNKQEGFIAIGSAITSWARFFTISRAQKNFYNDPHIGFVYADTDSLHIVGNVEDCKGVEIHDTKLCCWKLEQEWSEALFVRQKTYIEKEGDSLDIKCAGLPKQCKQLFALSMAEIIPEDKYNKLSENEKSFVNTKRKITDFKSGLRIPSKLLPKQIDGGILLVESFFTMR